MNLGELKRLIRSGALDKVRAAVDDSPELLHTHDPDLDQWEEKTALHW